MAADRWYMGTNTKMTKTAAETAAFVRALCDTTKDISREELELFVIPSYTALWEADRVRDPALLTLGAQNMGWEERGQYTGEISPLMLLECGVDLVMIGHSERRHVFFETDEMERRKVRCALDHGLQVLLCVGETEAEKDAGLSEAVLERQLDLGLKDVLPEEAGALRIAYEPVWAIGTAGKPVTFSYADAMLSSIRDFLVRRFGQAGRSVPLFYGGSVNDANAVELSRCREIDGLFVGRSAWDAERFDEMIRRVLEDRRKRG